MNAKVIEQENKVKLMMKDFKPIVDVGVKNADGSVGEDTLREAVDSMGLSLKSELLELFEDDRRLKNIRFSEVFNLIESTKNLINEHIA